MTFKGRVDLSGDECPVAGDRPDRVLHRPTKKVSESRSPPMFFSVDRFFLLFAAKMVICISLEMRFYSGLHWHETPLALSCCVLPQPQIAISPGGSALIEH